MSTEIQPIIIGQDSSGNTVKRLWFHKKQDRIKELIEIAYKEWTTSPNGQDSPSQNKVVFLKDEEEGKTIEYKVNSEEGEVQVTLPNTKDPVTVKVSNPVISAKPKITHPAYDGFGQIANFDLSDLDSLGLGKNPTYSQVMDALISGVIRNIPIGTPSGHVFNPNKK